MEFHVLGPLEIVRQGRTLELGTGKQRTLVAALLLHANEVVSTDRLIDALWGETAPATAPKIVQGYVSRLRKVLEGEHQGKDRSGSRAAAILLTRSPGYVLRVEDGQLDADRFAALLAKARAALAAGAALEASTLLGEALGLWRGPPLSEFAFDSFAQEEIARLEELRLAALEERVEADLALARQHELVVELEALVARHPLRERLRGQLMLALYRCGRQAEALQAYQDTRRVLVEELGLEPSRAIVELEQAILRQDPTLDVARPRQHGFRPRRPKPTAFEASEDGVFVGRERELAALLAALETRLRPRAARASSAASRASARAASRRSLRAGQRRTAQRSTGGAAGRREAHLRTGRGCRCFERVFASAEPSSWPTSSGPARARSRSSSPTYVGSCPSWRCPPAPPIPSRPASASSTRSRAS